MQKYLKNVGNKVCLNLVIHYVSAHTVLTLPKIQEICSVTLALTLERSHTHVKCVGSAANRNIHLYRIHFATRAATDKTKVSKNKWINRRILKHVGVKPYSCKTCERCFAYCGSRNNHMRKVHSATDEEIAQLDTNKKLHQCPHCPYSTKRYSNFKDHIRTHTGEKPYSCKECGRSYSGSTALSYHMYSQHMQKPSSVQP